VAALALPDEPASRGAQQFAQRTVELRSHSGGRGLGFAQRDDLRIERGEIDAGISFFASSSLTEAMMMTSSPSFQLTGVATRCLAVSGRESHYVKRI